MLSREGPPLIAETGMDFLKAMIISAKATPITIPRFLDRARKLEARLIRSLERDPMIALLLAGLKNPIPMPKRTCRHKIE